MAQRKVVRGEGETRQRILEASMRHFANASYDQVSLRDIAADVDVDVAYVHRSFGSKENLFLDVLRVSGEGHGISKMDLAGLAPYLANRLFERECARSRQEVDLLLILVHSLNSQKTGPLVAERLQSEAIEPVRETLGDPTHFRATMIISLLICFSIMRNLLQLPAATEIDAGEAEILVAKAIEGMIRFTDAADCGEV